MIRNAATKIFINCDTGEGFGNEAEIMPWIDAVNIACGYHAGDAATIWQVTELAVKHNILIGAHPSFPDKENFGRKEMNFSGNEIYDLIIQQLFIINEIVNSQDAVLHHVKPHGALYNMSARDPLIAGSIAKAVFDFNPLLILIGLSESHSIAEAEHLGLQTAHEVFADRTYRDDGTLTPRLSSAATITEKEKVVGQVRQIIETGTVTALSGNIIPVKADTICIHGDGESAAEFAKVVYTSLYQ